MVGNTYKTPRKVLAKRLTEPKTIIIVKDGVEGELRGEPGHIHVVETTEAGNEPRERIYSEEIFKKKYDQGAVQQTLLRKKEA